MRIFNQRLAMEIEAEVNFQDDVMNTKVLTLIPKYKAASLRHRCGYYYVSTINGRAM